MGQQKTTDPLAALTAEEVLELANVANGADVWGYANAMNLRAIERKAPDLVRIVGAMEQPPGHMRQPYFGAIATPKGRAALKRANGGAS